MSRRKATWIVVIGVILIAIVLTVRAGVKTTSTGSGASKAEGATGDYAIEDAPDGGRDVDSTGGRLTRTASSSSSSGETARWYVARRGEPRTSRR